ncbi:SDR family NAD(P)-dependent oxidoreductase [Mangrovimicrobium sediminis]|nr:SDR family oxidoreductase [Haliea sp. SAOS-164]
MQDFTAQPSPDFAGRHALVYGGGKGIGRAIALEFARRGAQVAVADIDRKAARECAAAAREFGVAALDVHCDVTDAESVRAAAQAAEDTGAVDLVVNNVGAIISGHPEDIPLSEWQRILDLNLMPVIHSNDVFLPRLLERGAGHIVNTASFAGLFPYALNRMPYVAAKAAVIALSESLALYCEPRGVRVSCFCPGPVATEVLAGMRSWTEDAVMCGPGSQYELILPDAAARTLAEGMLAGRIMIPTHTAAWEDVRAHAADPDAYLRRRMAALAEGDPGLPQVSEALRQSLRGK